MALLLARSRTVPVVEVGGMVLPAAISWSACSACGIQPGWRDDVILIASASLKDMRSTAAVCSSTVVGRSRRRVMSRNHLAVQGVRVGAAGWHGVLDVALAPGSSMPVDSKEL